MFHIMIVEDDDKIRSIVAETLRKWQYKVHEVNSFDQVLAEFEQARPHLVLLDINLPVFDGFYWCHEYERFRKCRLFSFPLEIKIWILLWRSTWVEMISYISHLIWMYSLPK